jgi:hypothetical protein
MRETVAFETPVSFAICAPVQRWRRNAPMRVIVSDGVGRCKRCGRDERSCKPAMPSARNRLTHLCTVRGQTPTAALRACGVCPPSTTRRTMISRPAGVSRAFLWTSIRFPQGSPKLQQLQHPRSGPNGQPIETSQLEHYPIKFDLPQSSSPGLTLGSTWMAGSSPAMTKKRRFDLNGQPIET